MPFSGEPGIGRRSLPAGLRLTALAREDAVVGPAGGYSARSGPLAGLDDRRIAVVTGQPVLVNA
jgi:hypothetical protein